MESERLAGRKKAVNAFGWSLIAIAVASLIGIVVCLFMLGIGKGDETLLFILTVSFFGSTFVFGCAGYLLTRLADKLEKQCVDAWEREDGENSFSIGEGTLATFQRGGIWIHRCREEKSARSVRIPYSDVKAFSVCLRREAKESGEWCVVFEVPAKYLAKKGKEISQNEKACFVTQGKKRLYDCLEKEGVTLTGEEAPSYLKENGKQRKSVCLHKRAEATLPRVKQNNNALILLVAGLALAVAGVLVAVFATPQIGIVMAVLGVYLAIQCIFSLVKHKTYLAVYDEGIFYRAETSFDSVFLKWEEVEAISKDGDELLIACPVTAYRFPYHSAVHSYCKEKYPEKCKEKSGENA